MDAATAIGNAFSTLGEHVNGALQHFIAWLIALGTALTSWIPDHTPIVWPDPSSWSLLLQPLGMVGRFVPLPVLFATLGLIIGYNTVVLIYAVYRAVLGFIPTAK